jgi:hypothetical protein
VPLLPPLLVLSQEAASETVHAQPLLVVTVTLALPPPEASGAGFAGETAKLHGAASCVIVTGCPATVRVAVRGTVVAFAVAV